MAITENELIISNKSYINKDFEAVYTELLQTAKNLMSSTIYDPTQANESDPFIVLLKLAAFVTDKVNYNVDKNILERFILSCTQETSMRELTAMLGYEMHYYQAAETDITFRCDDATSKITIPKFSIIQTNDSTDSPTQFITTEDAEISDTTKISKSINAIQGQINTLYVDENDVIQLENLDANNRLYFPERMVAENGVFIEGGNPTSSDLAIGWERKTNLNVQDYNSSVYKFGFDSKENLPYIEFPEWINNIIGNGLSIKYVVTSGLSGNVAAKSISVLNSLYGDATLPDDLETSDIIVINTDAAISGANPETIDESYQGFKKVIGTYDTLVTCRDYANAIYNLVDSNGIPYVSNSQVADRRTDMNYGCNVVTYSENGQQTISKPLDKDTNVETTAYDLFLYNLKPIKTTASNTINYAGGYNDSYKYNSDINTIENALEEYKCVSHDYNQLKLTDIFTIQNKYKITATIITKNKVDALEQKTILANIQTALATKYNPRTLDFGYEIAYDDLLNTITSADSRIKSVSLPEPEQTPYIITADNKEKSITDTTHNYFKIIVAKNLLAGKISAFEYDEDFDYKYYQSGLTSSVTVNYAETKTGIEEISSTTDYELNPNEVIELMAPNMLTKYTYPYGVLYYMNKGSSEDSDTSWTWSANVAYKLTGTQKVIFRYQDSNDNWINHVYTVNGLAITSGEIFEPGEALFDKKEYIFKVKEDLIYNTDNTASKTINNLKFYTIGTTNEVYANYFVKEEINSGKNYYWLLNNADNELNFDTTSHEYLLQENEYFFYTDTSLSYLTSYGQGTKLKVASSFTHEWGSCETVGLEEIVSDGLKALEGYFKYFNNNNSLYLTIIENQILTLIEGNNIKVAEGTQTIDDNSFTKIDKKITYTIGDTATNLEDRSNLSDENKWYARAILDINSGPDVIQTLVGNQSINFYNTSSSTAVVKLNSGESFNLSNLTQKTGGSKVDLGFTGLSLTTEYPKLISYTYSVPTGLSDLGEGYYTIDVSEISANKITLNIPKVEVTISPTEEFKYDKGDFIMMYAAGLDTSSTITLSCDLGGTITGYNKDLSDNKLANGMNVLNIINSNTITLTFSKNFGGAIVISKVKLANKYNSCLGIDCGSVIEYIKDNLSSQFELFYINANLESVKLIDINEDYPLSSAQAFYDYNNIANKWVLPKIDFTNSSIKISSSSKK